MRPIIVLDGHDPAFAIALAIMRALNALIYRFTSVQGAFHKFMWTGLGSREAAMWRGNLTQD
ncbi:uncharacterized protein EI90DRAFT_3062507 [Cantharellus anzutake]|uniref:uncharacterized protein n=1 Tax=Cantharellus anzutake TaxID=1750568 RepID=UPI0019056A86|nr:uncharacterized protein EI90DRAFT_3062507 [Cantharellus anzutake]KAF8329407.1 hypothetical protein EI90DRAFT_3062507 [Cantharellus anzutake]